MDGGIDYQDHYLIDRLKELFPGLKMVQNNGSIAVRHNGTWGAWNYQQMAPEQQLDTMIGNIELQFGIRSIKSENGDKI